MTRRRGQDGTSFLFAIKRSRADATVRATGVGLVSGERFTGTVPAGGVALTTED